MEDLPTRRLSVSEVVRLACYLQDQLAYAGSPTGRQLERLDMGMSHSIGPTDYESRLSKYHWLAQFLQDCTPEEMNALRLAHWSTEGQYMSEQRQENSGVYEDRLVHLRVNTRAAARKLGLSRDEYTDLLRQAESKVGMSLADYFGKVAA